jgi:hypothetical protein
VVVFFAELEPAELDRLERDELVARFSPGSAFWSSPS